MELVIWNLGFEINHKMNNKSCLSVTDLEIEKKRKLKNRTKPGKRSGRAKRRPARAAADGTEKLSRYQRWRARAVAKIEERLERESKREIILKFFAAPIVVLMGAVVLYLILDLDSFYKMGGWMIVYLFPPMGKESAIPLAVASGLHPMVVAFSMAFVDMFVALFLLWNYDFAKLIPILGPWMERVEKKYEKKYEEKPWLEKLAITGLVLFVMFPLQGSGGVGTTIVGRIFGVNKFKVFGAICVGAVIGCLLIAYFSDFFISVFAKDLIQGLILLIIIAIGLAVYNIFKYRKKGTPAD